MPRYFFHTLIDDDVLSDPEGAELSDADQAWDVARATAGAAVRGPDSGRLVGAILLVTDAEGEVVLEFPFAEALTLEPEANGRPH